MRYCIGQSLEVKTMKITSFYRIDGGSGILLMVFIDKKPIFVIDTHGDIKLKTDPYYVMYYDSLSFSNFDGYSHFAKFES